MISYNQIYEINVRFSTRHGKEVDLRILIYRWNVFNQEDIKSALENLGNAVDMYTETDKSKKQEESQELMDVIKEHEVVLSVNYFPRVSDACQRLGRKYIAWTVDSPLIAMYHQSVFNECNYIFIFDKVSYYQFKQMGVKNVYHMPLAVNAGRVSGIIAATPQDELDRYNSQVSFVGGLYHKNSYDAIEDKLTPYLRGYFECAMEAQMDLFGDNLFDRILTVDILSQLSELVEFKQQDRSFSDLKLVFASTFLGFKMAQKERIRCLNRLAASLDVDLYSDGDDPELVGVNLRGSVNYEKDMPKVFNRSKVNMNFTMRNIRSGIPLRVWDVLGAGGFLLTNFQAELPAYFENGKDLVYYDSTEDMLRKAEYYMNHEDERATIAANGHKLVAAHHSYETRLQEMLRLAGCPC